MTTTTFIPASTAQVNFITDLLATRQVEPAHEAELRELLDANRLTKQNASATIESLLKAPKASKTTGTDEKSKMQMALASVPKSFYAVPTEEIELGIKDANTSQGLFFIEVKEYMGTLYMRRLHGAPGGFSRSKLTTRDQFVLLDTIKHDPTHYARLFGEHHGVCGKCGADLTDDESRRVQFGPVCRKTMKI